MKTTTSQPTHNVSDAGALRAHPTYKSIIKGDWDTVRTAVERVMEDRNMGVATDFTRSMWRDEIARAGGVKVTDVRALFQSLKDKAWQDSSTTGERFKTEQRAFAAIDKLCGELLYDGDLRYIVKKGDRGDFEILSERAARSYFSSFILYLPQQNGGDKEVQAFDVWKRSSKRRIHHGLTCDPDVAQVLRPGSDYNTWRGIAGVPKTGKCDLLKQHIADYTCGGDKAALRFYEALHRDMITNPGRAPGVMMVLTGARGAGKSIIVDAFRDYIGPHHTFKSEKKKHLLGDFTEHQLGKLLIVIEEMGWAGDKEAEGVLKNLITSTTIAVEAKFGSVTEHKSFVRFMLITNERWAVPVGVDERRFFVLNVKSPTDHLTTKATKQAHSRQYFDALAAEIKAGAMAAWIAELVERTDLDDVDLRRPPMTEGLRLQARHSLPAPMRWLDDALERGGFEHDGDMLPMWFRRPGGVWTKASIGSDEPWPLDAEAAVQDSALRDAYAANVKTFGKATAGNIIDALREVDGPVSAERLYLGAGVPKPRVVKFGPRQVWRDAMGAAWGVEYASPAAEPVQDADDAPAPVSPHPTTPGGNVVPHPAAQGMRRAA